MRAPRGGALAAALTAVTALTALALVVPTMPAASGAETAPAERAAAVQVRWQVPAQARVGTTVTTRVRFTPARPRRQVLVHQLVNGSWQYLTRALVGRDGAVVRFTQLTPGPTTYRLRLPDGRTVVRTVRGTGRAPVLDTRRLSVTGRGAQISGSSGPASASDDGRLVAFVTNADNATRRPDTNRRDDVYLKNTVTGAVRRISVGLGGAQARGYSAQPVISGDGRRVAFVSKATNLVRGDTSRRPDLFVWTRATATITRVAAAAGSPSISTNGRLVVFRSRAGGGTVQLRDLTTGALTRLGPGAAPSISGDGRLIAYQSRGRVLLRDRIARTTRVVSTTTAGAPVDAQRPRISADGSTVAFESTDPALGGGRHQQVYRHDLASGTTTLLSVEAGRPGSAVSILEALSSDGSRVLLTSAAPLVADDVDAVEPCESESDCAAEYSEYDAYLADAAGAVSLVSRSATGKVSEFESHGQDLTADGRAVVFSSSDELVPGQTPGYPGTSVYSGTEVFVRDLR